MALLVRNDLPTFPVLGERVEQNSLYLEAGDPTSRAYGFPSWYTANEVTSWSLAMWLVEQHERRGWIPRLPLPANMKHAKSLLAEYDSEYLVRVVHFAGQKAQHPFTFSFVRRIIGWESPKFPMRKS